jgi:hypothetical protein
MLECSASVLVQLPIDGVTNNVHPPISGNIDFLLADGDARAVLIDLKAEDRLLVELATLNTSLGTTSETADIVEGLGPVPISPQRQKAPDPGKQIAVQNVQHGPRFPRVPGPAEQKSDRQVAERPSSNWTPPSRSINSSRKPSCDASSGPVRASCLEDGVRPLEAQLDLFEKQSASNADRSRRELLAQSRQRFEVKRKACQSTDCLRALLLSRTTEVARIMKR